MACLGQTPEETAHVLQNLVSANGLRHRMVMKILIIFFFKIKESKITRGHNFTLVKKQSRLDVRKFSFSQRTINARLALSIAICANGATNFSLAK